MSEADFTNLVSRTWAQMQPSVYSELLTAELFDRPLTVEDVVARRDGAWHIVGDAERLAFFWRFGKVSSCVVVAEQFVTFAVEKVALVCRTAQVHHWAASWLEGSRSASHLAAARNRMYDETSVSRHIANNAYLGSLTSETSRILAEASESIATQDAAVESVLVAAEWALRAKAEFREARLSHCFHSLLLLAPTKNERERLFDIARSGKFSNGAASAAADFALSAFPPSEKDAARRVLVSIATKVVAGED